MTTDPSSVVRSSCPAPVHSGRLVLTPGDPRAAPNRDLVLEALVETGLIGAPLARRTDAYAAGEWFLGLISFAGCSVAVELDPAADTPCCHVRVPPLLTHPELQCGRNTKPPRCEGCRAPLADWRTRLDHWRSHPHAGVVCPSCGEIRPPWRWDWKGRGGFGRLFILVEEVFPGEATPTPSLLERLTAASGTGWRHFFVQD